MKRLIFAKVNFTLALGIIAAAAVVASGFVARQSVNAMGMNVGGRITKATPCVIDNPSGLCPTSCHGCSATIGQGCNAYVEIDYTPSGGTPGPNWICIPKGYRYLGGGVFPRIGAWLAALMLGIQVPVQVGIGR